MFCERSCLKYGEQAGLDKQCKAKGDSCAITLPGAGTNDRAAG